jgi:hypothetical protein
MRPAGEFSITRWIVSLSRNAQDIKVIAARSIG